MHSLKNFIVLCITAFFCLIVIEFSIRGLYPHFDPSGHVTFERNKDGIILSKKRGNFRQIKNTGDFNVLVKINGIGLRESKPLKTSTLLDFFVVGDSFSFGWGVAENARFSNQLESLLENKRVYNISIPTDFDGYNDLISYAKKNGAKISNLIIGVTMENDIHIYEKLNKAPEEKKTASKAWINFSGIKNFLRDHSAGYFLITTVIHNNAVLKKLSKKIGLIAENLVILSSHRYNEKEIISSAKKLSRISKKYNSIVLIIPSRALWVGSEIERITANKIHSFFISEIEKLKIDFIDMRIPMEQSKNPMVFHFKNDGHWTAAAHRLAAQQLAKKISSALAVK